MKKTLALLAYFCAIFAASASDPVRLTVDVGNSGDVTVLYMDFSEPLPADTFISAKSMDGKTSNFTLPDDERLLFCFVLFENATNSLQNLKLVLLPGERIDIKGEMFPTHSEFSITGSDMFEAWAEHRKTYLDIEKEIISNDYESCDPELESDREKLNEYHILLGTIYRAMTDFMDQNPSHPLSALYYCYIPGEDPALSYDKLTGRIKEGDYKRLLDYQKSRYEQ